MLAGLNGEIVHLFYTYDCVIVEYIVRGTVEVALRADVRTAKIGNALWGWNVQYREEYEGADLWKGAPAIRKRRARPRLTTRDT